MEYQSRSIRNALASTCAMLCAMAVLATPLIAQLNTGPTYDDPRTQQIVEGMVQAHGGFSNWIGAPSFQFTAGMYLASLPINEDRSYYDNWRYYRVTIEPKTSHGIVELPLEDNSRPTMAYDGHVLWSREYDFDPSYRDGPFQLLFLHYGWVSLPWLTQQPEVALKSVASEKLPGSDVVHNVVEMTFSPANKQHGGYFRLFIDPETSRLRGFTQTVGYAYLPGNVIPQNLSAQDSTGGVFRIIDAYAEIDGMVVPKSYYTIEVNGEETKLLGAHLVIAPSFKKPFDTQALSMPSDGRILLRTDATPAAEYHVTQTLRDVPFIDGKLDDTAWSNVVWNEAFFTQAGGDPTQTTAFALTYDDTYLYVGLALNDESPGDITRTPGDRDDTNGDRIAMFLDTNTDGLTTKVFVINAAGVVRDQVSIENGTQWDNEWDTDWTSAFTINDRGWSVEMRIPFASLDLSGAPTGDWGFQLSRVVERLSEQSFWSRPDPSKGFVGSFGRVMFRQ